jgi:hypothetical protein
MSLFWLTLQTAKKYQKSVLFEHFTPKIVKNTPILAKNGFF